MADDRGSSAAAIVLVFLSGAALGAVAALLLAPQTGRESREQLRGYARRAEDNLWNLADRAGETFEEVVGEGKEFVDSKKSVLREAFDVGREAMMMYRSGADVASIRASIERKWTPKFQTKTPTPMPPPRKK